MFVDEIENPELGEEDDHHFGKVLRLRNGDRITVSDGEGNWRECIYGSTLEVVGEIFFQPLSRAINENALVLDVS